VLAAATARRAASAPCGQTRSAACSSTCRTRCWRSGVCLLDPASLEESLVGRVLPDVRSLALFRRVDIRVRRCRVLRDFGLVTGTFLTSIGGRHRRHMIVAGHSVSLRGCAAGLWRLSTNRRHHRFHPQRLTLVMPPPTSGKPAALRTRRRSRPARRSNERRP
jgi:hypothetical protein